MKIFKVIFFVFLLSYIFCCSNRNDDRIIVNGYIIDSLTKKPIKKARVTVVCWYDAGWDKRDYQFIDTITNDKGYFHLTFDRGYKIIVASVATNYLPAYKEAKIISEPVNIFLNPMKKCSNNQNDSLNINLRKYIINNTED